MKSTTALPQNYEEVLHIDLQKDKKPAVFVNLLALAIGGVMFVLGHLLAPIGSLMEFSALSDFLIRWAVICVAMILYIIGHEWVHSIFMRRYCEAKVNFGFTGMYAYAGSAGYYCRRDYMVIALAPLVAWGILFTIGLIPLFFFSKPWFWSVYLLQIINISGAAGDIYVFFRFRKLPEEILVNDTGVAMTVFAPKA